MKTKFVVVMEIGVTHSDETFVDVNSIKSVVGTMLNNGRRDARPWVYDEKNEGPAPRKAKIFVRSMSEYVGKTSFGSTVDIEDIEEYA